MDRGDSRIQKALFTGLFDGATDEVPFERSGSFFSRIERIVAAPLNRLSRPLLLLRMKPPSARSPRWLEPPVTNRVRGGYLNQLLRLEIGQLVPV